MTITINNKTAQNLMMSLKAFPENLRASKAKDLMCEVCGYYDLAVVHDLVKRSLATSRGKACRPISNAEHLKWANSPAYTFEV